MKTSEHRKLLCPMTQERCYGEICVSWEGRWVKDVDTGQMVQTNPKEEGVCMNAVVTGYIYTSEA